MWGGSSRRKSWTRTRRSRSSASRTTRTRPDCVAPTRPDSTRCWRNRRSSSGRRRSSKNSPPELASRGAKRSRAPLGRPPSKVHSALVTYIIAEPCIDIKDRSCVDVCPVDCIHEFERILIIDPEECIDCFAPSESFLTTYGVRSFAEMENQPCSVLTDSGFKPALVKKFRRKPLVKIDLAPAFEERDRYGGTRLTTRNISRFRRTIRATPTHAWLFADGEKSSSLAVGQVCPAAKGEP